MSLQEIGLLISVVLFLSGIGSIFFLLYKNLLTAFAISLVFTGIVFYAAISTHMAHGVEFWLNPITVVLLFGINFLSWLLSIGMRALFLFLKNL